VLGNAGIDGFLENLDEFYETAGREESQWSRLLEAIHQWARGKEKRSHEGVSQNGSTQTPAACTAMTFTAKELAKDLQAAGEPASDNPASDELGAIRGALPDEVRNRLRSGKPIARSLGKRLGNRKGTRFPGGWHVQREDRGRKGTRWAVCPGQPSEKDSFSGGTFSSNGTPSRDASSGEKPPGGVSSAETPPENAPSEDRPPAPGEGARPKPKTSGAQAR
jgi:hypothetical protein